MNELRIVLLGKTGDGKSSCGNVILGEEVFVTGNSPNSVSKTCESKTKCIRDNQVTVVDTPGFFDTTLPSEQINSEILRCMTYCAPGPHAFVIVLKVGRYTKQERQIVQQMINSFGEEALKHSVVLFTFGNQLDEGQTIENYVKQSKELQDFVDRCGGRCHVIDNKYWNKQDDPYKNNAVQVEKLMNTIEGMVRENKGQCYSNEILRNVHKGIEVEIENLRRESNVNLQNPKILTETAQQRVHAKLKVRLAGAVTGALLGALFGCGVALITFVPFIKDIFLLLGIVTKKANLVPESGLDALAKDSDLVTEKALNVKTTAADSVSKKPLTTNFTKTSVVALSAIGGVAGGFMGYDAAKEAETVSDGIRMAANSTYQNAKEVKEIAETFFTTRK